MLFSNSKIPFQKFSHGFRLQRSITTNTSVTRPIFNDENELIWILNPKSISPQINDDTYNTKNLLYFNIWSHNAKYLTNEEQTWGTWTTCFDHQIKGFSISTGHTANHWYNCNSYFKVDMIASSFDIIYPQKSHHFQSLLVNYYYCLNRVQWKNTYNKRRHIISIHHNMSQFEWHVHCSQNLI